MKTTGKPAPALTRRDLERLAEALTIAEESKCDLGDSLLTAAREATRVLPEERALIRRAARDARAFAELREKVLLLILRRPRRRNVWVEIEE